MVVRGLRLINVAINVTVVVSRWGLERNITKFHALVAAALVKSIAEPVEHLA